MGKNIFEGSKFGDLFVTRNGHQACYLGTGNFGYPKVEVLNYYGVDNPVWNWDGTYTCRDSQWDIVDKGSYTEFATQLHKTVDEDKLDELAHDCAVSLYGADNEFEPDRSDVEYGFKAGYRSKL